jgi:hypothetical protein
VYEEQIYRLADGTVTYAHSALVSAVRMHKVAYDYHMFTLTIESVTLNFRCIVHVLLKTVYGIQCLNFKLSIFTRGFYVASSCSSKLRRGHLIGVVFFGRNITQSLKFIPTKELCAIRYYLFCIRICLQLSAEPWFRLLVAGLS